MLDRGSFAYNFSVEVTAKIYSMQRLCWLNVDVLRFCDLHDTVGRLVYFCNIAWHLLIINRQDTQLEATFVFKRQILLQYLLRRSCVERGTVTQRGFDSQKWARVPLNESCWDCLKHLLFKASLNILCRLWRLGTNVSLPSTFLSACTKFVSSQSFVLAGERTTQSPLTKNHPLPDEDGPACLVKVYDEDVNFKVGLALHLCL